MRRGLVSLGRGLVSLGLLAVTVALGQAAIALPVTLDRRRVLLPLGLGLVAGVVFFTLVSRLAFLYVVGHELTHWLVAKLFLRRTGRFRIGRDSGSVAIERPNIWITLAPYFVPVHAILWIGLSGVAVFCWPDVARRFGSVVIGGVGVTYAFHVRLTIDALRRAQSDLRAYGPLLSCALILCCNVAVLLLALAAATGQWGEALLGTGRGFMREVGMVRGVVHWLGDSVL